MLVKLKVTLCKQLILIKKVIFKNRHMLFVCIVELIS